MPYQLSRIAPAKEVRFEASAVAKEFTVMNPRFREIRSQHRDPLDKCFWCNHKFVDGETIAIAFGNKGNKVLCQTCADLLLSNEIP